MRVELTVNGRLRRLDIEPNDLLINLLRDRLHLTGTKYGCGIGTCGACTVLLDGEPVLSCLTLAVDAHGREVRTVEGLAQRGRLDPVQQAFLDEGAVQCGYCTPGFIMTAEALLRERPEPTEEEIREYIKGNYCRCTGYVNIVRAIQTAARRSKP